MMDKQPIESWIRDQAEVATQRGYNGHYHERMAEAADRIRELEAELAALRKQQGEPVAWLYEAKNLYWVSSIRDKDKSEGVTETPLYRESAPKQQGEPVAYLRDDGDGGLEFSAPGNGFAVYREAAPRVPDGADGPDCFDGHDCEGFPGGCERMGCPGGIECTAMIAAAPEPGE